MRENEALRIGLGGRHVLPRDGQLGFGLESGAVVVNQRLVDRSMDAVGQRVVLRMNVPGGNITGAGPLERLGDGGAHGHSHGNAQGHGTQANGHV